MLITQLTILGDINFKTFKEIRAEFTNLMYGRSSPLNY